MTQLHARLATLLAPHGAREVKMFGGVCFMVNGHMLAGVSPRGLLVRVGPETFATAVARPGARAMEMGGRAMKGYVFVDPESVADEQALASWMDEALAFNATLPAKGDAPSPTRRKR